MNISIKDKVKRIIDLAVDFNDSETRQDVTGNKPTVFVDFCGHTCQLDVSIHRKGYDSWEDRFSNTVYLDQSDAIEKLNEIINVLEKTIVAWLSSDT